MKNLDQSIFDLLDSSHRGGHHGRSNDIGVEVLLDGLLTQFIGGHQPLPLLILTCPTCSNLVHLTNNMRKNSILVKTDKLFEP